MPGPLDPFTPGQDSTPFAGIDPKAYDNVRSQWDSFLSNPQGRAAMLSAGLALMQPPSFGDSASGQIGRAIGAAGQSVSANEASDLKKQELESKDAMREATSVAKLNQADAAMARADAAGARMGTAGATLELKKQQLEDARARSALGAKVKLSGMYQNYVRDVSKRNSDPLNMAKPGFTPEPILPITDWAKANPMLQNLGLLPEDAATGDGSSDVPVPAASDTTSLPQANPNDPNRRPGRYMTPKGPMTWNGSGWVQ